MYKVYILFIAIMTLSFVTGNILLLIEHKFLKKEKVIPTKTSSVLVDEEIL